MSQEETVRARNNIIILATIASIIVLAVVIGLVIQKVGVNFGDNRNVDGAAAFKKEAVALRTSPVGKVNIGGADATASATVEEKKSVLDSIQGTATTEQALALIKEKSYACMGCHQVDGPMVGPSYTEVAAKYQGDAAAADMLAEKIKAGGTGTWGSVPMPPNAMGDTELKILVDWILSLTAANAAESMSGMDSMSAEGMEASTGGDVAVLTDEQATALIAEKKYPCMTCHKIADASIGPSYKQVADKYKGDTNAPTMLAEKITTGGSGTWGQIPMSPNPNVSDEDMNALVTWILSL